MPAVKALANITKSMNVMQWQVYVTEMALGHIYSYMQSTNVWYSKWIVAGLQASKI
jgi:hypothetical protein